MSKLLCSLASSLVLLLAVPAQATVQRAHVSAAFGADSNTAFNCDAVHPCRFFQAATTVVSSGGEVVALDSGGYGTVNITQSISLIAPAGVYAGISVFAGSNGINIATAGVNVTLRGLTINGMGGNYGIYMADGVSLTVQDCTISNFTNSQKAGIAIISATSTAIKVSISDTTSSNNYMGVLLDGSVQADISRVSANGNTYYGIALAGIGGPSGNSTTVAVISDSSASQNGQIGFLANGQGSTLYAYPLSCAGACVRKMELFNSRASSNGPVNSAGIGVYSAGTNTSTAVSGSTMTNNFGYGLYQWASVLKSSGNNVLSNNGTAPTTGTITTGGLLF